MLACVCNIRVGDSECVCIGVCVRVCVCGCLVQFASLGET